MYTLSMFNIKQISLDILLRPYENKWVALNRAYSEVLASGDTPEQVLLLAQRKSSERPIITLVPSFKLDYVG